MVSLIHGLKPFQYQRHFCLDYCLGHFENTEDLPAVPDEMATQRDSSEINPEKLQGHIDPGANEVEAVNNDHTYHIDPEDEEKVVRKLDCVIMPLMALVYFFQCRFDRATRELQTIRDFADLDKKTSINSPSTKRPSSAFVPTSTCRENSTPGLCPYSTSDSSVRSTRPCISCLAYRSLFMSA